MPKYIRVTDCEIGNDSNSGLAFACTIEDDLHWVPYSVCRKCERHPVKGEDAIEVEAWWADKHEVDGTPC